ncbi:uncharacterized protein DUF4430 [Isoptericola jiangsuensis]|uniref:Uncharacterized protein DUF4430 n=1 Tax=Isoptericola jiangsuensis TaxID=548579 RepID=A0A2A9EY72_9MICO|nr:DUF4430 domain-containing protein [Isoptericola jiangsuensis]PFG43471.1 uncharacterized protein DUF4430 [Isoptericola jiangsuensis]
MTISTRPLPARLLAATTAGLLSVGLLAGCSTEDAATPAATASASAEASAAATEAAEVTELTYEGETGRTALDLLLEHDPQAEVSGEGEMAYVTGIGGRTAEDGTEFWGFYVDGEMAEVGAGSFETEDGQQILWKLEKIES